MSSDPELSLDVLQHLEDESGLPLVALGLQSSFQFANTLMTASQVEALIHRKPVAWYILRAWQKAGVEESLVKQCRTHLMRIDETEEEPENVPAI